MLTPEQQKRLDELIAKKKEKKLDNKEFSEFKKLMKLSKQKSHEEKDPKRKSFDPGNNFAWWSKLPDLIRDSASFKCNYIAGKVIDPLRVPYVVPGILAIHLATMYHASATATDPINVWARNNYLRMFQKYRPASGYSASDQGITILAALEAVKLIATYERIYGIINRYSTRNVNMPTVEAEALGLSSSQLLYLQSHLSDFRYDLNFLIRKAQRLCIPKDIALIDDSISLLGFEYIDHSNPRGQIILFTLDSYGVYSDTNMSTGGSIDYHNTLQADLFDFNAGNMCYALDVVLNALLGSDSVQRIFADLVVWFGEDAMLQFYPMPEDYLVLPAESKSILHKVHNLELAPAPINSDGIPTARNITSWAISGLTTSDTNYILNGEYHVYQFNDNIVTVGAIKDTNTGTPASMPFDGTPGSVLEGTGGVYGMGDAHVIDGYDVDVTPEFVVEGSLLKYVSEPEGTGNYLAVMITSNVDWIVTGLYLHSPGNQIPTPNWCKSAVYARLYAGFLALVDWAPLTYSVDYSGSNVIISEIQGDLDIVIPTSAGDLTRIQRTCFLSALMTAVPVKTN